jgi:hypothetical protein
MKQILSIVLCATLLSVISCKAAHKSTFARAVYDEKVTKSDSSGVWHAVLINHYNQKKAKCRILQQLTTQDGTFLYVDSKSAKELGIIYTSSAPVEVLNTRVEQ